MATDVFAYGKLPLAFSARCFTARHYDLNKDACQYRCADHPDGLMLPTREGQPFLTLNGIQTMSAQSQSLLHHVADLAALGIEVIRLSPQTHLMEEIVAAFDHARRGVRATESSAWNPAGLVDGYWTGGAGIAISA